MNSVLRRGERPFHIQESPSLHQFCFFTVVSELFNHCHKFFSTSVVGPQQVAGRDRQRCALVPSLRSAAPQLDRWHQKDTHQTMDGSEKKVNWFVRTLIILFCIFVLSMIAFSFFWVKPAGEISTGVLSLLSVLLVVILSESFDNFSIGKLISLSRDAQKKEKSIKQLEKDKNELLKQLISISTSQSQNQQHTNVYGDYTVNGDATVERASEKEVEAKETDEREPNESTTASPVRINLRALKVVAMADYIERMNLHKSNVIPEAKLVTQFYGIDPISNFQPIFDGYYQEDDKEIFVEVRRNRSSGIMLRDRIYLMLSKINFYRNIKGIKTHLDLVLVNIPSEGPGLMPPLSERLQKDFEPAIASGLLRVSEINITEEQISGLVRS